MIDDKPTPAQFARYRRLMYRLTSATIDEEWEYFQKYARRFNDNPIEQRYGILPMGVEPGWNNMLYSDDVAELRLLHLEHIAHNGGNDGHRVALFIERLEIAEGKKRPVKCRILSQVI